MDRTISLLPKQLHDVSLLLIKLSFFCGQNPSPLQKVLLPLYKINNLEYNMLFSVYSYANIFLCLVAGYFVDKIGARLAYVVFCLFMLIGHFTFYLSSIQEDYTMALVGRFIFGVGSECQQLTFFTICGLWFN